jgi:hypothetical protein
MSSMKSRAALLSLFLAACLFPLSLRGEPPIFIRGDVNGDRIISQADIFSCMKFLKDGNAPRCADAADFDDSGVIDITDMINLVGFLYIQGRYPSEPYNQPGPDPTEDGLDCESGIEWAPLETTTAEEILSGAGGDDEDDGQVVDFIEFFNRSMKVFPGQRNIRVPILLSNVVELDGFTVAVRCDPTKVWLQKIEVMTTFVGDLKPEYVASYNGRLFDGYLSCSVFMDYVPPFEGNCLPRSRETVVGNLVFGISPEALVNEKYQIQFEDIPAREDRRPVPMNEVCSDGSSMRPTLDPMGIELTVVPESTLFVRGDPNRDYALNITDVILILHYLFNGEEIACLDSVDVDDSGKIDLSDAIALAMYLFDRGFQPAAPFPNPGRDATSDSLGNCR